MDKRLISKNHKVLFFISFFLCVSCFIIPTQDMLILEQKKGHFKNLEILIPELMKKARIPGLSIAVIRNGKIQWHRGFGVKNNNTGKPVTDNTIFEAASLTKPLFAYAVMRMVEEGVLELDVPLIKYVPEDQIEKAIKHPLELEGFRRDWFEKITARMVLSHSSGLPHGERGKPFPIFFEPGTKYKYSAVGYYFLQMAVQNLKKEKLEFTIKKYVLDPLEMKNSWMVWKDEYEKTAANGHGFFSKPEDFRRRKEAHSAATLYTTAKDYARFICAVLNTKGLTQKALKRMLSPHIDVNKERNLSWSLGFGLQKDKNGKAFWQWGDYGIFRNYIVAYSKEKIGIIYLTNSFYGLSICSDIVSNTIGGKPHGVIFLKYDPYDSPFYKFAWTFKEKGIKVLEKLYEEVKSKNPDVVKEAKINSLGYFFMNDKFYNEAIALFKLNVRKYPQSANTYDSLAEAYMKSGNVKMAIKFYEKTLKIIPIDSRPDKTFLKGLKSNAQKNLQKLKSQLKKH